MSNSNHKSEPSGPVSGVQVGPRSQRAVPTDHDAPSRADRASSPGVPGCVVPLGAVLMISLIGVVAALGMGASFSSGVSAVGATTLVCYAVVLALLLSRVRALVVLLVAVLAVALCLGVTAAAFPGLAPALAIVGGIGAASIPVGMHLINMVK